MWFRVQNGALKPGRAALSFDVCRSLSPGVVCLVVTVMYWSGWEIGAVEAVSLSILVGSSVDYCVHLVEGFLLAGESLPPHLAEVRLSLFFLFLTSASRRESRRAPPILEQGDRAVKGAPPPPLKLTTSQKKILRVWGGGNPEKSN